jgi:dihydrofolate reductase
MMAKLIATALTSLDGYTADENGEFGWSAPDLAVHAFVNDIQRPIGTYLYGRKMYETMVAWETMPTEGEPSAIVDFTEIWRAADKVVYSTTLDEPSSVRTRIERTFDPDAVRALKEAAGRDLSIGGPTLAAQAFRAGLVDEVGIFLNPVTVGGGTPFLPEKTRLDLDLLDQHTFDNGVVYLHYRVV